MIYHGVSMALNLKNADVERLAAEVSRLTGESKTEAIRKALEERRRRLKAVAPAERRARLLRLLLNASGHRSRRRSSAAGSRRRRKTRSSATARRAYDAGFVRPDAVLFSEPGYLSLVDRMLEAETLRIGTPTLVETSLVFESRRGTPARQPGRRR